MTQQTGFTLAIDTGNAAFDDTDGGREELARILRETADKLENGSQDQGGLFDINGNRVGQWLLAWEGD